MTTGRSKAAALVGTVVALGASVVEGPWQSFAHLALGAVAAAGILFGIFVRRVSDRLGWALIGTGCATQAVGSAIFALGDEQLGRPVTVLGAAALLGGMAALNHRAKTRRDRAGALDALLIMVAASLAIWHVGGHHQPGIGRADLVVDLASSFLTLGALALAGRLTVAAAATRPLMSLIVLGLSISLAGHVFAETGWAPSGVSTANARLLVVWGLCLIGAAALLPRADAIGQPSTKPPASLGPIRIAIAAASFLVPPVILLQAEHLDRRMVAIGTLVITGTLVARVTLILRDLDRAHRSTRQRDRWYRSLVRHSSDLLLITGDNGKVAFASASVTDALGRPSGDVIGKNLKSLAHTDHAALLDETFSDLRAGTVDDRRLEVRLDSVDSSSPRWFELTINDRRDHPDLRGAVINAREITQRKAREDEVSSAYDKQASIAALGRAALSGDDSAELGKVAVNEIKRTLGVASVELYRAIKDEDLLLLEAAAGATDQLVGHRSVPIDDSSLAGYTMSLGETVISNDLDNDRRFVSDLDQVGVPSPKSGVSVCVSGTDAIHGVLVAAATETGAFTAQDTDFLATMANELALALQRRDSEDRSRHQALHDPLTGLPNRLFFQDRLHQITQDGGDPDQLVGILFLDLDHFKEVNDTLGHDAGDELLCEVAKRLGQATRASDTVARLGGDEFVVLCENLSSADQAKTVAERVREKMAPPTTIKNTELQISTSIGIAVAGADTDTERLLNDADAAMYQAKQNGRSSYAVFDFTMRDEALSRHQLETELREALPNDELELHHQPIVDLGENVTIGYSCLVRWHHPERGLLSPDDFMPVAENTDLVDGIGRWMVRTACERLAAWPTASTDGSDCLFVNLSASELEFGLVDVVRTALTDTAADPRRLVLEFTETEIMRDIEQSLKVLDDLNDMGVTLVIDDFGLGHSSLVHLNRLPVHALKIDQEFVASSGQDSDDTVSGAVIHLGRSLGLSVIAEGIQSGGQMRRLLELGCDLGQGSLFGDARPWQDLGIDGQ